MPRPDPGRERESDTRITVRFPLVLPAGAPVRTVSDALVIEMSTMPTGRSVVATCAARAALAGNPSDGYGGAVVAVPIHDLLATVATTEADAFAIRAADPDLHRLLTPTAEGYAASADELPPVTLSASTAIPRSVGLAGSSALVVAALRSLGGWTERRWDRLELAELALSIERDRLGFTAGLQDRLVQSVAHPVLMRFDPVSFEVVEIPPGALLWVAWHPDAAAPSDIVHRSLRRRWDAGDPRVVDSMAELAVQARRAHRALVEGDIELLGEAMDRTYGLRAEMIEIPAAHQRLVDVGRRSGAAVNSAGSGGSVVGLAREPQQLDRLRTDYRGIGAGFCELTG